MYWITLGEYLYFSYFTPGPSCTSSVSVWTIEENPSMSTLSLVYTPCLNKYADLHSISEFNEGQSGALFLLTCQSLKLVSRGNIKFRQSIIWDVTLGGNLIGILTCPESFPCSLLVLTQLFSIIWPSCFEVERSARSYSGKAAMLLQKDRLLSGCN